MSEQQEDFLETMKAKFRVILGGTRGIQHENVFHFAKNCRKWE